MQGSTWLGSWKPTRTSPWPEMLESTKPFNMNSSMKLIAAPFTPFNQNGSLNLSIIEDYADRLYRDGVSGVFVAGTTGEGMSLTEEERKRLVEAWRSAASGKLRLFVHVGHSALETSIVLSRHAQQHGADAIAAMGPTFFAAPSPLTIAKLGNAMASAAPDLPFFYYHLPSMSRVSHLASDCLSALSEKIPNFGGIKFTHDDLVDYQRCIDQAGDRYEIFFGRDELFLQGLISGATSAVGSTYNFAAPLYSGIHKALSAGQFNEARRLQKLCSDAIMVMLRFGGLPGIKATLAMRGIDCGAPRLPLESLNNEQKSALRLELEMIGYFDLISK